MHTNRNQRVAPAAGFISQWHRYQRLVLTYWWVILAALALALGVQWWLIQRLPPAFESSGQMIVNVKLSIPSENTYSEELANFYGTQVALMQSDSVNHRVNLRLRSADPGWHPERVRIQVLLEPKTSIFNLAAVGGEPRYTQAYLEAVMEEFINLKRDLLVNASTAARSNLQDELTQLAVKLDISKQDYLNYQSSNSIVFLQEDGVNSAAAYLSALSRQLAECQSELQLLNSLTPDENFERQPDELLPPGAGSLPAPPGGPSSKPNGAALPVPSPAALENPATANLAPAPADGFEAACLQTKEQIVLLEARKSKLGKLAPDAFELVGLNDEIENQEKLLNFLQEQRQEQLSNLQEQRKEQLNNRRHTLEVQIQNLGGQIKEWDAKALDASQKQSVFAALKEKHQQLQAMYDQLHASLQTLDLDKGTGLESVTILEPATPAVPVPPKTLQHLILAAMLGLVAGLGVLLLVDQLNDRPGSFCELEALFTEPVLAQLPLVKAMRITEGAPVLKLEEEQHMLVEAYQNLRSALVYKDSPANHPRSIVIASALAHDGKSTVAANFAITLAQTGSRVLLVDADLRRGLLHHQFEVAAEPGLAEVLARQCDWKDAVVPTSVPNLFLLPSGIRPPRPGSLFAMHTTRFLADIAGHYDYYVFDTSPVMAADDVSSLAPHVDGVIMVIRAGFTPGRIAKIALDTLRLRNVKVIGLAFNAVQINGGYHYYRDRNYHVAHAVN
jgi:capsular exopolysaccharide synthesis family protein